jgi:hypothetical protein
MEILEASGRLYQKLAVTPDLIQIDLQFDTGQRYALFARIRQGLWLSCLS